MVQSYLQNHEQTRETYKRTKIYKKQAQQKSISESINKSVLWNVLLWRAGVARITHQEDGSKENRQSTFPTPADC